MTPLDSDTIAAIATAPGKAGVGIVRVSGAQSLPIAKKILSFTPKKRYAHYSAFYDASGEIIDRGIALFYAGPHSFTGEDIIEFQAHGGPIVLDLLLKTILSSGARHARPGEFSERAFLNDKLDLVQAEAIADLIDAESEQAAKSALHSLQGDFSNQINLFRDQLIELRMYVESAIDFPEEEIDFLADGLVMEKLEELIVRINLVFDKARQGALLREGMKVVIAGRPNAGKSSLLNALAEKESAIVTSIEGTTRDILKEHIQIDGMPLHIIDTAGLRENADEVEKIGISRALDEIHSADRVLLLIDSTETTSLTPDQLWPSFLGVQPPEDKVTIVRNKVDRSGEPIGLDESNAVPIIRLSAKTGTGLDALREHLKDKMGYATLTEGVFVARRRHLNRIEKALEFLENGRYQLGTFKAGELLAEDLRSAQDHLGEITGEFTSDDLLGQIFSSFCIGK
ncbi:MAG: tRNA uridine-5-carboxymethylaminomethyl(34) synthesis GTPase MnmE [Gammaproteobacteria bacterium]|nr:MAG: tRNA uridine-5-carboxymethylaminomethyl(34) synthesis GTPase MnmE [Pseudomonadota bacterium]PIE38282.1 MAG: tRNA uridine-5-carboxymethylaminomethyl(34) synthesis GTPase MnmE [Gammaproteobacteria bacterium]